MPASSAPSSQCSPASSTCFPPYCPPCSPTLPPCLVVLGSLDSIQTTCGSGTEKLLNAVLLTARPMQQSLSGADQLISPFRPPYFPPASFPKPPDLPAAAGNRVYRPEGLLSCLPAQLSADFAMQPSWLYLLFPLLTLMSNYPPTLPHSAGEPGHQPE